MQPPERLPPPPGLVRALEAAGNPPWPRADLVHYFTEVTSTSDVASALARQGAPEGTAVVADAQTRGRGRRGRAWYSAPGAGLYVSVVLRARSDASPRETILEPRLTLAAGVAVAETLRELTGIPAEIKWPNDVVAVADSASGRQVRRKLAGILAEAAAVDAGRTHVILGIGVNVRAARYPAELVDRVTSIEAEAGAAIDRWRLLAALLQAVRARAADLRAGRFDAILARWRALAPSAWGSSVEWTGPDGTRRGRTAGLASDGALLVDVGGAIERILGGEVTWL